MKNLIDRYFGSDKWNIGYVQQSAGDLVRRKQFKGQVMWLQEDAADYSADPFIVHINSNLFVYYEELNFWKVRGSISRIKNFDFQTKESVRGFNPSDIHFSYPYIFQETSNTYCIPETADADEVCLYQLNQQDTTELLKKRTLLKGARFVDSSIIRFHGKYWLFTNIDGKLNQLYIFHSESLDDDFKPHRLNPIPVDTNSCRGAGQLFVADGQLYRPTQNLALRYGGSIMINRIVELTESSFSTEFDFELSPEGPYQEGMHHISFARGWIVVDGKRRRHAMITPIHRMLKKMVNSKRNAVYGT